MKRPRRHCSGHSTNYLDIPRLWCETNDRLNDDYFCCVLRYNIIILFYTLQQCCFEEVDRVIAQPAVGCGDTWGHVGYEDITKLTYINQVQHTSTLFLTLTCIDIDITDVKTVDVAKVIKETLRLHPPAAMIARTTTDGCQLGDYKYCCSRTMSLILLIN